ncbi:MATE family efflux transporter [Aridibaculum aurantiacum]|uniref:MATE family efflux transporter n=1 Tax=Aridibaculum aurantiacum TaxID=2810307 RepID=UPI001A9623B9|nr:MATE family efflux transporter [Aridibaculum aurantiacum]
MWKEFNNTLKIAGPIIIGNLSQVGLGLIDSAMIGAIDYRQLAASSLVINVLAIPQVFGIGITMAISPLVAMANGRKDIHTASRVVYNGVLLSTIAACIIAIGMVLGQRMLFHLGQDAEVAFFARDYYVVMAWSLIPMMIYIAVKQFADALEFTRTAMILSILSLPLNAFLNWIFIYGQFGVPRLELYGAGIATLITRILIAVLLIIIILKHRTFRPYIQVRHQAWKLNKKLWKELLNLGVPSSLQYGMEAGAFSVSGIMIGWLGATAQAAHQIALNLASTTFMAALGLSLAGSIRVANAFGRYDKIGLRNIGKSTIAGGLGYGTICALLFILLQNVLPGFFTNDNNVAMVASSLLIYAALFQISDATQAIGVGLLRGIKDVTMPTIYVAIAYWIIGIPVGYLLAFHLKLEAAGIWLGFVCGLTISSVLLNARFLHKTKLQ